jgi:hypothetical protein
MSEVQITSGRDGKTGRFVPGNKGNGGRPKGSRNKLGEAFLEDLRDAGTNTARKPCERVRDPSPALSVRSLGCCRKASISTWRQGTSESTVAPDMADDGPRRKRRRAKQKALGHKGL